MNHRLIGSILGSILWVEAGFMALPLLYALFAGDGCWPAFAAAMALCLALGAVRYAFPVRNARMQIRDGYVAVAMSWLLLALTGAVPYLLTGAIPRFSDAFFETASGLTTTGASILPQVEMLPRSVLLWRSETQWMGGMGVLVLFLALMPKLGDGAVFLMRAESPGPIKSKLVPKVGQTAKILYAIYVGLTALEAVSLRLAGVSWYDAVNHAFTTMATGGFSTRNGGVNDLGGGAVIWIITLFTFFAGLNFSLMYLALRRRWREVARNEELRLYAALLVIFTAVVTASLVLQNGATVRQGLTEAAFQVTTIITTTGYSTADFARWPALCQGVLMVCMLTGACAGSTAGGVKLSRLLLLYKGMRRELDTLVHPNRVSVISMDGQSVPERSVSAAQGFLTAYVLALLAGTLVVSLDNIGLLEAVIGSLTCVSNVGPGLGALGPTSNFSALSALSKYVLSFLMLLGRLELMPLLVLLSRGAWKK